MPNLRFVLILLAAMFLAGPSVPQNTSGAATITVRLINGKNGKPIKDDWPSIHFTGENGIHTGENPATDSNGEVIVKVRPPDIAVMPNFYFDCRYKNDDVHDGIQVKYSIEEILKTGIVTENLCGKRRLKPIPGVLILYVRPRTLIEGIRL